jgi:ABC-2 type transport system permease protein
MLFDFFSLSYSIALGGSLVVGGIIAGASFGLNPFGNEQDTLALVLTTPATARQFIDSRLVAGLTLSVPFLVVIPGIIVAVSAFPFVDTVAYVGFGWILAFASGAWAVGLGTAYPKYDSRRIYGVESATPSIAIVFVHMMAVSIMGFIGLLSVSYFIASGLPINTLLAVEVVLSVVLVGTAIAAYRYAIRRYRSYTID